MLKTFNCGLGLLIIIENKNKKEVFNYLKKKKVKFHLIGKISSTAKSKKVIVKNFGKSLEVKRSLTKKIETNIDNIRRVSFKSLKKEFG